MLRQSGPRAGLALRVAFCIAAVRCGVAMADGVFLTPVGMSDTASSAAQKAILIQEGADEVLLLQTTYAGPASEFAWIVPVPVRPSEVFEAEPAFLDEVFRNTDPEVIVHIPGMRPPERRMGPTKELMVAGSADEAMGGPPPAVTVLERREMGDYDLAVLSATGEGALLAWLDENEFAVSDLARGAFESYVADGFAFVCVRFLSSISETMPMVRDVTPIGIRFVIGERLWFPLTISRASAPPLTSVLLCLIADSPMACETLPCVRLPEERREVRHGESYGSVREAMTRGGEGPALLCEYCGVEPLPFKDLDYRADAWGDSSRDTGLPEKTATRFYGLLAPEEMTDLWFRRDEAAADHRVVIECSGTPRFSEATLVAPQRLREDATSRVAAPIAAPPPSGAGPSAHRLPWGAALAVGAAALLAGALALARRRGLRSLLPVLIAAAAGLVAHDAGAGLVDSGPASVLRVVEAAIRDYQADCGCYPAALEDLVIETAPTRGLDVSGNDVPLTGTWHGPYLSELPPDPFGVGLVYDVRGMGLVDYAGMDMHVSGMTPEGLAEIRGGPSTERPGRLTYWDDSAYELTPSDSPDIARWLAKRESGALPVATPLQCLEAAEPHHSASRNTLVADPTSGEYIACGARSTVEPVSGDYFSARTVAYPTDGPEQSGVFRRTRGGELARFGRRPVPAAAGLLEAAPGGTAVAMVSTEPGSRVQTVWIVRENDTPRFLAQLKVLRLAWSPDGSAVYVLGWPDDEPADTRSPEDEAQRHGGEDAPEPTCDLFRIRLSNPVPTVIASGLSRDLLTVGEPGALVVQDGDALLFGHDGEEPRHLDVGPDLALLTARFVPEGLLYAAVVPEARTSTAPGPWYGEIRLARGLPDVATDGVLAKLRWAPGSHLALLGCANDGCVMGLSETDKSHRESFRMEWVGPDGSSSELKRAVPPPDTARSSPPRASAARAREVHPAR